MVSQYDIGLEKVLADPECVLIFREFLKDSYSSENLAFIVEVENFKHLWSQGATDDAIKKRANDIFQKYFSTTSQYELNIPGPISEEVKVHHTLVANVSNSSLRTEQHRQSWFFHLQPSATINLQVSGNGQLPTFHPKPSISCIFRR